MQTRNLVLTALFAALIFTATMLHVQNGFGGVLHAGDAFIFLAATMLPFPLAMPAAAIGAGLMNFAVGSPFILFTILIKPLLTLPFTGRSNKILGKKRNVIAPFLAALMNASLYFFAYAFLFDWGGALGQIPSSVIQALLSILVFYAAAAALDRLKIKERLAKGGGLR